MPACFAGNYGVQELQRHSLFFRDGDRVFRSSSTNNRGEEAMGPTWSYLNITPIALQDFWEDSPEGSPPTPPYKWWNWHDNYDAETSPDPKWVDIITDPEGAASRRREAEAKAS